MFLWKSNWLQAFVKKASFDVWFSSTPNRWRRLQRWVVPIRSMVPITCHQYLGLVGKGTCVVPQSLSFVYMIWLLLLFLHFILLAHHLVRFVCAFRVRSRWDGVARNLSLGSVLHCSEWCFRISWQAQYSTWVRFPQEQFSAACQHALCIYRPAILSTSCVCCAQLIITPPCLPVLAPTNLQVWWSSLMLFLWEGLWAKFSRVGFAT